MSDLVQLLTTDGDGILVPRSQLQPPLPNIVQLFNAAQLGPADPIDFAAPPITAKSTGRLFVKGSATGTLAAQQIVTVSLVKDGTTTLYTHQYAPGGIGAFPWSADLTFVDTVPIDGVPHTYSLHITTGGLTTVTVPINGAFFQIVEVPF